ncbi:glutathione transferase [Bordetella sp. 15P40C-2]|uniref:glutathione transferase n=1 Tax=Bordetella sp. 15P40C-2 TaxID=2572246 RepID=UPI00132C3CC6|nr:glutathione transferase [Bordetella sp. 15P40C-2]MVW70831.1 glutathione transferase [Bordetella sp. 15P40C-2]
MSDAPLTLYVDARLLSPYAMSAYVALAGKGLPVELRMIDLQAGEQRLRPYASRALTARVPALTHQGFHLTESSAIIEYVEEVFPAPQYAALFPDSAQARARMRQIQAWLRSDLGALREERPTEVVFHGAAVEPLSAAAEAAAAKLLRVAQTLLPKGQPSLFDRWTIADTELALMLRRLAGDDELPPALQRYADEQWQRPPVQAWLKLNQEAR